MADSYDRAGKSITVKNRSAGHRVDLTRGQPNPGTVAELAGGEPAVEAVVRQQLFVGAPLDDPPLVQHQDLVGVADRRQPMGDDQHRAVLA